MITKINKTTKWMMGVVFFTLCSSLFTLSLASCAEDDDNGSANVGLGIKAFFPTKVVTNQPVTINGSGFNGVTEIEFPGGAKVTDFEIIGNDMIRVITPAGIPSDGGKIIVRTADDEAESRLPLTLGHTNVTGFSKQPGDVASGGELITVYGTDLEFITGVELLDAEGEPQLYDHKDFYRKGTNNLVFRIPQRNIYDGVFTGKLFTYDGQTILLPELTYEPGAADGHMEIIKVMIWENKGQLGDINWSSNYRFAGEGFQTGEECYIVPADVWNKMKNESFKVKIKGANPQIRVTDAWWQKTWTGNDIFPGNEALADNGDGTWTLTVTIGNDPVYDLLDVQHLLFTGSGYSVEEIYFEEEQWVDGPGGGDEQEFIWQNDGSLGENNWANVYRFAPESNSTGEECYTVPQDIWDRMKTETFFIVVRGSNPSIRLTTGWWDGDATYTGADVSVGNDLLTDNGDGTWTLTVNLANERLAELMDSHHLLITGGVFTVESMYFFHGTPGGGGGGGGGGAETDPGVIWNIETVFDSWSATIIVPAAKFKDAAEGNIIRVTIKDKGSDYNPIYKHVEDWSDWAEIQAGQVDGDGYFEAPIPAAALDELKEKGLRFQGVGFTIVKVELLQ